MNSNLYVHVKNIDPASDRKTLYSIFNQFGNVLKLQHKPDTPFVNVFYATIEECNALIKASQNNTWRAEFGKHIQQSPDNNSNSNRNYNNYNRRSNDSANNFSYSSQRSQGSVVGSNSSMHSGDGLNYSDDSMDIGEISRDYKDVHGRPITVRKLKSGEILVPLTEIRKRGFAIFHKDHFDSVLIDKEQILQEFYLHLLAEGRKFLVKNKVAFADEERIKTVIEKVKSELLNQPTQNNLQSQKSPEVPKSPNRNTPKSNYVKNNTPPNKRYDSRHDGNRGNNNANNMKTQPHEAPSDSPFIKRRVVLQKSANITITSPMSDLHNTGKGNNNSFLRPPKLFLKNDEHDGNDDLADNCTAVAEKTLDRDRRLQNGDKDSSHFDGGQKAEKSEQWSKSSSSSSFSQKLLLKPAETTELRKPKSPITEIINSSGSSHQIEPLKRVTLKPDFQEVTITYVENPTTCWVCVNSQAEELESILLDVSDCEPNCKKIDPVLGNVCIAEFEANWYRSQVVSTSPLKVSFIDFGNVNEVPFVKDIPKELADKPAQAIKVELDDLCGKVLKTDETLRIKPLKKINDESYLVTLKDGKPNGTLEETEKPGAAVEETKLPSYFGKPDPAEPVKNGDMVMIVGHTDSQLYVRTKSCYTSLKQIQEEIQSIPVNPVTEVKPNQAVLALKDGEYRRAVVLEVGSSIKVEFIDYPETGEAKLGDLRSINESLAKKKSTFILTPKLRDIDAFGDKSRVALSAYIANKTKFNVLFMGNVFDLIANTNKQSLVEEIIKLDKASTRVTYDNMDIHSVALGEEEYLVLSVKGADNITLCSLDDKSQAWLSETVEGIKDVGSESYIPEQWEVCLGNFEDNWYRCTVREVKDNNYDVLFIDYGNDAILQPHQLRPLPLEFANIPVLGLMCCLTDVPHDVEEIDQKIKEIIQEGEVYKVNVVEFENFEYKISIPEVTNSLKGLKLM